MFSCCNVTLNVAKCLKCPKVILSAQAMTLFVLYFRALTEQQSRISAVATQHGRRENCLNMRPGETVHHVLPKLQVTLPQGPAIRAVFALHKKHIKV